MAGDAARRKPPFRVVQWTTGKLGAESLRQVIDHPDLDLVGLYVHSAEKAGRDAGSLCGRPDTGVLATRDIAAICALDADVVLHMPMLEPASDTCDAQVERLLAAGLSVISLRGYWYPAWRGRTHAERFAAACRAGGSVLFGAGISPGFVFDRVGPLLSGFCTNVTGLRLDEFFDLRMRPWHTVHDVCGLGFAPGVITPEHPACVTLTGLYAEMYHLMAHQLGTRCDNVSLQITVIPAEEDLVINSGTIRAGTGKATIWHWTARLANGLELNHRSHWHVGRVEGWDARNVWIVSVEGEPAFRAEMPLEHSGPDGLTTRGYDPNGKALAALCINAIPDVLAAPPGILFPPSFAPYRPRFA